MKEVVRLIIGVVLFVYSSLGFAHQDKILTFENGSLSGLPEQYGAAYISLKSNYLIVGTNKMDFPECVSKYFLPNAKDEITITYTASWYHDLNLLPAYLNINIEPKGKADSYSLLFELETLKPIGFQVVKQVGNRWYHNELKISEHCQKSIDGSYSKVKSPHSKARRQDEL